MDRYSKLTPIAIDLLRQSVSRLRSRTVCLIIARGFALLIDFQVVSREKLRSNKKNFKVVCNDLHAYSMTDSNHMKELS